MLSRAPAGGEAFSSHCLAAPLLSSSLSVIRVCLGSRVALGLMHREKLSGAVARIDVEVCSPLCMGHRNYQHLDASRTGNHRHLRCRSCEALREGIAVGLAVKLFSALVCIHIYSFATSSHKTAQCTSWAARCSQTRNSITSTKFRTWHGCPTSADVG